jgi:phage terminase small subunit
MADGELTMLEALFINEYVTDWNASAAFKRLVDQGFVEPVKAPQQSGYKILQNPRVRVEVEKQRERVLGISELNVEMVVKDIRRVLNADPKEMTEHHKDCCRYCHGEDHDYQFTKAEMKKAKRAHEMISHEPFDECGGVGFDPRQPPVDDCPECHGRGVMTIIAHDTRTMSEAASALYMGVKPGKHGTEILTRSKDQARKDAAAFLGMNKETINLLTKDVKDMSDEELALIASGATK